MHWNFASDKVCFQDEALLGKIQAIKQNFSLYETMYKGSIFPLLFNLISTISAFGFQKYYL